MMRRSGQATLSLGPSGVGGASLDPADRLLNAACENARTLAKLCDVLEAGPASATGTLERELPDGAFILPEEF